MSKAQSKIPKSKKKNFSSFTSTEAFKQLNLTDLIHWEIEATPVEPSAFFQERMQRLEELFNLDGYEESKNYSLMRFVRRQSQSQNISKFGKVLNWNVMLQQDG